MITSTVFRRLLGRSPGRAASAAPHQILSGKTPVIQARNADLMVRGDLSLGLLRDTGDKAILGRLPSGPPLAHNPRVSKAARAQSAALRSRSQTPGQEWWRRRSQFSQPVSSMDLPLGTRAGRGFVGLQMPAPRSPSQAIAIPAILKQSSLHRSTTLLDTVAMPIWAQVVRKVKSGRIRQHAPSSTRYTRAQLEAASKKLQEEGVPTQWWARTPTTGGLASAERIPRSEFVRGGLASNSVTHPILRYRRREGVFPAVPKTSSPFWLFHYLPER